VTPGDRIWYPMTRICVRIATELVSHLPYNYEETLEVLGYSASLRNGDTTAGLFRCCHGLLPSRSRSIHDR